MNLSAVQDTLRTFAAERNWQRFHTPKNLSMALMVEAAELMELFQWQTADESRAAKDDATLRARIGEELADVLLYLLQMADQTNVDLQFAVEDKLRKNALKHPVPTPTPTPTPKTLSEHLPSTPSHTHVLVDWENVQPKDVDIRRLVPDVTDVWIFHGPKQNKVDEHQKTFGENLTLVPISRSGKNALDFHLSFYMGYITQRNPDARFVVLSNDQGYGPMLEHAMDLGFAASQVGISTLPKAPAKRATPRSTTVKQTQVVARKTLAAKKSVPTPKKALSSVKVAASKSLPAKKSTNSSIEKLSTSSAKKPDTVKSVKATSPVAKAKSTPSKTPSESLKAATAKTAKTVKPAKGKLEAAQVVSSSNVTAASDDRQAYAHVLSSLLKSKDKPARKARLQGAVKSLLKDAKANDDAVEGIVARLVSDGHLEIDNKGAVTMKS